MKRRDWGKRIEDIGSLTIASALGLAEQVKAGFAVYRKVVDSAKLRLD